MNNRTLLIVKNFIWRDLFVCFRQIKNYIVNYTIIYPVLYSFTYGYIIPNTLFDKSSLTSVSIIITGSIVALMFTAIINFNLYTLIDFENDRHVNYQLTILNPRLVVVQKIFFSAFFVFILLTPFFVVAKLILRENLDTSNMVVSKFLLVLFLACIMCSAYVIMCLSILKGTHRTGSWWRRVNNPMLMLGGSWVPWVAIYKFSPVLSYIVLLNPIIYVTEGIRGSVLGGNMNFPYHYCIIAILIYIVIFINLAFYFFKKRTDHINLKSI